MRIERGAAWLVLALGLSVLIATSAPEDWSASRTEKTSFESQGAGDDKLALIRVQLGPALWRDLADDGVTVSLSGLANRPISDVHISWQNRAVVAGAPDASTAIPIGASSASNDAGVVDSGTVGSAGASDAGPERQHFDGFLKLASQTQVDFPCRTAGVCELLVEARISAETAAAYALDLEARVDLLGDDEDRPKGPFEITLEVRDAP